MLAACVDAEVQQRRHLLWIADAIRQFALNGGVLKISGDFVEYKRNVGARQRDFDNFRGRCEIKEGKSSTFADDLAVAIEYQVGRRGCFDKTNTEHCMRSRLNSDPIRHMFIRCAERK